MNILIAGAGIVGFKLAKTLSKRHNVVLIDKNEEALDRIQENIDILTIVGNAEDPDSYKTIEDKSFDVFIAVTNSDEANIISSIIMSEKIDAKRKIIRLKKEFFAKSSIVGKIGITDVVFPHSLTAKSITSLIKYPKANNIKSFIGTKNKLISIKIDKDVDEQMIQNMESNRLKIIGMIKNKRFQMYTKGDYFDIGDRIYLFGDDQEIERFYEPFNNSCVDCIKNVAIFGADILGIEIAKNLIEYGINIKIIEKDFEKCDRAAGVLKNNAMIINTKYSDFRLYDDERIKNADMIIASTANDEENIIKCIEAKNYGVQKVIAINNDSKYYNLMHSLGVSVVKGPKNYAFYSIIEKIDSSDITTAKHFCGGFGVIFSREIKESYKKIVPIKKCTDCITLIIENDKFEILNKKITLTNPALVIVFGLTKDEYEIGRWIHSL